MNNVEILQRHMQILSPYINNPGLKQMMDIAKKVSYFYNPNVINQIQKQKQIIDTFPFLKQSITYQSQQFKTSNRLLSRVPISYKHWGFIQSQISTVSQLPEWHNIRSAVNEPIVIEKLFNSTSHKNNKTTKHRKRLLKRTESKTRYLTVGDLIALASLFITIYEQLPDETVRYKMGIILSIIYILLISIRVTEEE